MDIYGNEVYNINQTLKEQNEIFQKMLGVMNKPENKLVKVLKFIGLTSCILAIITIIEKIIIWIIGG